MVDYFLGVITGMLVSLVIVICLYIFRPRVVSITNEIKKSVIPSTKGAFIEREEVNDHIKKLFSE